MIDKDLLAYLEEQKQNEYKFKDADKLKLVYLLIENIGVIDGHLRDDIIYPNLAHLLHDDHLEEAVLEEVLELLIGDKYLHFDLENFIEFSVLTRSFTTLQLVILVYKHNKDNVISERLIRNLYDSFIDYFDKEENLQGYKETVGWMHSIAHAADLFAQLVKVETFAETELKTILNAITKKLKTKEYFFVHDEDERMVNAVMNAIERDLLDKDFLKGWVYDFANYHKIKEYPEAYYLTNNIKNFLRSLYFRLLDNEKYKYLVDEIRKVLKENVKLHD